MCMPNKAPSTILLLVLLLACKSAQKNEDKGPNAELLRQSAAGNAAGIDAAILAGGDPLTTDARGRTPLMLAVLSGNSDAVKILLQPKSAVAEKKTRREGVLILNYLNRTGSKNYAWVGASLPDAIQGVMAENFDFKRLPVQPHQRTADAIFARRSELLPELLSEIGNKTKASVIIAGAYELASDQKQINITTVVFTTADNRFLTESTVPGYLDARLFESLSAVGAQIVQNLKQYTSAEFAIRMKNTEQPLISDVNARDRSGNSALYHAAAQGQGELIRLLIAAGADYRADAIEAINFGDEQVAANILSAAPEVDFRIAGARTPLIQAAFKGRESVVRSLIERKAKVDLTDVAGFTALLYAAQEGHAGVVRLLLEAKANPNLRTWDNFSPLEAARRKNRALVAEMLVTAGAK